MLLACPDCGNACSSLATVCPRCARPIQPGDLRPLPPRPAPLLSGRWVNVLTRILAIIVGLISFFVIGFILEALGKITGAFDSPVLTIFLVILPLFLTFVFVGAIFGLIWRKPSWKWGIWLGSIPALLGLLNAVLALLTYISLKDALLSRRFLGSIIFAVSILLSGCLGAAFGARQSSKRAIT